MYACASRGIYRYIIHMYMRQLTEFSFQYMLHIVKAKPHSNFLFNIQHTQTQPATFPSYTILQEIATPSPREMNEHTNHIA